MDQGGHDPGWLIVEVYDDSQPASRVEIATVEVLAARYRIVQPVIWLRDGLEDHVRLIHEVWPAKREVESSAVVKHDQSAVGVCCGGVVLSHAQTLRTVPDGVLFTTTSRPS